MSAKELPTPEEMQAMAEVDLKNIDTSNLIDIEQVRDIIITIVLHIKTEMGAVHI